MNILSFNLTLQYFIYSIISIFGLIFLYILLTGNIKKNEIRYCLRSMVTLCEQYLCYNTVLFIQFKTENFNVWCQYSIKKTYCKILVYFIYNLKVFYTIFDQFVNRVKLYTHLANTILYYTFISEIKTG